MSLTKQRAKVQEARLRMSMVRRELSTPAAALLARGREYPLTTVGTAAGAGFVLGSLNVHPLRIPGLGSLLGGGLAEAVAWGTRLVAELGVAGMDRRPRTDERDHGDRA
ncbi:hypothetical protein [Rhodanobacter sp. T12-5]|uniref:hypothetical protein n=1 Tax=Rhodanobacter sp. T12-5 TaxID=2024611 RepID=UPI0011EC3702|nr:hypothetical protein [Rhodanobacter sp. T12-5]KAA0069704.1 hypothetical protein CIW53_10360 [Rhodanobacter sp. T12-5]